MRRLVAAALAVAASLPAAAHADPVQVVVEYRSVCVVVLTSAEGIPAPPKACVPIVVEPCSVLGCEP
jgi:hypothetical protein